MELLRNNLYVYAESSTYNGKWVVSNVVLNSDGNLKIQIQNEEVPRVIHISTNCIIQAPMDTVWSKIPSLPFRRSARETFGVHIKKNSTTWFLSSSEEERTKMTDRKPPPYGDYDNWNYSHLDSEIETKPSKPFHHRRSLTPQRRTGFYSVQEPRRNSSKLPETSSSEHHSGFFSSHELKRSLKFPDSVTHQYRSGFYSVQEPVSKLEVSGTEHHFGLHSPQELKRSLRFPESVAPQHRTGFYSLHKPKKKTSDEPTISLVVPQEDAGSKAEQENIPCKCCFVALGYLCNVFSSCFHQCCINFAAAI
ncbi:uncharacterized protein TNIN_280161 [Trichonephila inaurata madagascariensis]|uniref:Uncharacterized protein n=1 Tax=Trichonephila inaurata madagascariensis TaxID=2747483 RepID=A0A8X7C6L7_9ARAC|nr:uncharacterized protein TNIN_280161 [Trichonephila inaurata madagascariensis]